MNKFDIALSDCNANQLTDFYLQKAIDGTSIKLTNSEIETIIRYKNDIRKMSAPCKYKSFGVGVGSNVLNGEWKEDGGIYLQKLSGIVSKGAFCYLRNESKQFKGSETNEELSAKDTVAESVKKLYFTIYVAVASAVKKSINPDSIEALLCGIIPKEATGKNKNIFNSNLFVVFANNADGQTADGLGAASIDWSLTYDYAKTPRIYRITAVCRSIYYTQPDELESDYQKIQGRL